jgi:hypothetical protein
MSFERTCVVLHHPVQLMHLYETRKVQRKNEGTQLFYVATILSC